MGKVINGVQHTWDLVSLKLLERGLSNSGGAWKPLPSVPNAIPGDVAATTWLLPVMGPPLGTVSWEIMSALP